MGLNVIVAVLDALRKVGYDNGDVPFSFGPTSLEHPNILLFIPPTL